MELLDYKIPSKKADTDHDILNILRERYSPRAFDDRVVEDDVMMRLFEAMRWAPSSMNEQPWRIIYAHKGEEAHSKIVDTLMPGNKPWAENAPVLMITLVSKYFQNGMANKSAPHDLGLAIGNLTVQATHEGLGLHQMGGFSPEKARESFQIPDEFEVVTAIAVGYFGDPDKLPEGLRQREYGARTRKKIDEFAFHQKFKI